MTDSTVRERLSWRPSSELHEKIRSLWIAHSKAEDERSLEGLIATLTPGCVYETVPTGERWEGHDGARAFYTGFLGAYPDVRFDLKDIVIGPQGVIEVTTMTGTRRGAWGGLEADGLTVRAEIIIHFPWDPALELFRGERIYFDRIGMLGQAPAS